MITRIPGLPFSRAAVCAVLLALAMGLQGCTAIGFGAGAIVDSHRSTGSASHLARVRPGSHVKLVLRDGRVLRGRLVSPVVRGDSLFGPSSLASAAWHVQLQTSTGMAMVSPDSILTVTVSVRSGKIVGSLLGLTADGLFLVLLNNALHNKFDPFPPGWSPIP